MLIKILKVIIFENRVFIKNINNKYCFYSFTPMGQNEVGMEGGGGIRLQDKWYR